MMTRRLLMLRVSVCLLFCCLAASLPAQVVQLRDGSLLVGELQDPTGEGFTLQRSDNGGVLRLRWEHLTPSSAKVIKTAFNLLTESEEDFLVSADVLEHEAGGRILTTIGRIVEETDSHIVVDTRGSRLPVPRGTIRSRSKRQVTPYEIYLEDDFYKEQFARIAPGEDADKHLELGDLLTRTRDYERAKQHLERARDLGGGRQKGVIEQKLGHLAVLIKSADETNLLAEIRRNTVQRNFLAAERKIAEFKEKYPESRLKGDLAKLEVRYKKARQQHVGKKVASAWYQRISIKVATKISEPNLSLAAARRYAESELGKEIRAEISKSLSIPEDEVEELWRMRGQIRGAARPQSYTYATGSWVLGEDGVIEGTRKGEEAARAKEKEKQKTEEQRIREAQLKRLREALERSRRARQRAANRGQAARNKEQTPEEWWTDGGRGSRQSRIAFLKAWYAEKSGDMEVTLKSVTPCRTCSGVGQVPSTDPTNRRMAKCPTCHGVKFRRSLRAR